MTVTIDLPPDVEQRIRARQPDLTGEFGEAVALALFRKGLVTHADLGRILRLDREETNALLKHHQVYDHALTGDDIDADVRSLKEFLGTARP